MYNQAAYQSVEKVPNQPYLRFYYIEREDRQASMANGIYTPRNVAMVEVTQAGGKAVYEDEAEAWLNKIGEKARKGEYPRQWATDFAEMYRLFKLGEELPESGTAIRMCLMFTPAEQKSILNANIRTLEDLAACTEEALSHIGPGGRLLRDRSRTAIEQSRDAGKVAAQVESLNVENIELKRQLDELRGLVESMAKPQQNQQHKGHK